MTNNTTITKANSWQMFDEISPRYDLLNRLLSFGLDVRWRSQIPRYLPDSGDQNILDCATGTGDVLIHLVKDCPRVRSGWGIDMAEKMMQIGRMKMTSLGLNESISFKHGDAHHIPFERGEFDAATIAFGIRNMEDPCRVLREMHRVLKPGGRALILEFSMPKNPLIRFGHVLYLRAVVPLIGGLVSGHYRAYKYLNQTIETFPYGDNFKRMLTNAGFQNAQAHHLLMGVATIYTGDKA